MLVNMKAIGCGATTVAASNRGLITAQLAGRIILLFFLTVLTASAQNSDGKMPPIIDVHMHANDPRAGMPPICPNTPMWAASDPATKEEPFGGVKTDCSNFMLAAAPDGYMKQVVEYMNQWNVTGVLYGDLDTLKKWETALPPGRVIPGTSFAGGPGEGGGYKPVEAVEADFVNGKLKVMGEIGLQYAGVSPNDPAVDKYWALAEKLDVPVAIHMGTGGAGRANVTDNKFRGAMGDPLLLEDVLARHPKLRVQVMHAGYPMIDNMLTLLGANSHVYVDIAGLIWSYPLVEVNHYIQRLVEAGFEDRVMFGTDETTWPGLLPYSIGIIENAEYLTPQQKRDILFNNAVRFYRLDPSQYPYK